MNELPLNNHPLTRDGRSQADRQNLRALSPTQARLDNRDEKQVLAYLYEFAKAVIHVDYEKKTDGDYVRVEGNWQEFFRTGSSVQLALIAQFDPEILQRDFKQTQIQFADGLEAGNYTPLLDFLFETALSVGRWHQALSEDTEFIDGQLVINENPLRGTIQNLIISNLQSALKQLMATANSISDFKIAPLSIQYQIEQDATKKAALSDQISSTRYALPNFSEATKALFEISPTDFTLRNSLLQQVFDAPQTFQAVALEQLNNLFSTFYKAVRQIVADTEGVSVLQPTQMHEPHLGLLYAFLRLFNFVQTDLNDLPKRHLDFYFRQVLGLKPQPYSPDVAHLVFENNKPFESVKIVEKTLIKDGKDSQKVEIQFATTDEIITTRAQVASLRTLYHDTKTTLFAAPTANSADGNGAPFLPNTDTSWSALGSVASPKARVGLLFSSPTLRLAAGVRTQPVVLTFDLNFKTVAPSVEIQNLIANGIEYRISKKAFDTLNKANIVFTKNPNSFVATDATKITVAKDKLGIAENQLAALTNAADFWKNLEQIRVFDVQLTGAKGWFRPLVLPVFTQATNNLQLKLTLAQNEQAVVPADSSVLKADFGVTEPLLKLELNPAFVIGNKTLYEFFKNAQLTAANLTASVNGVTNFIAQNQNGLLDATKPFQPFGAQPKAGDYFLIGSDELFRKKLTDLTLKINWQNLPTDFVAHYKYYSNPPTKESFKVNAAVLNQRVFVDFPLSDAQSQLFSLSLLNNFKNDVLTDPSVLSQFFGGLTEAGFIKLTLNQGFKHEEYAAISENRGLEIARDPTTADTTMPLLPITPTIESMTLSYTATDDLATNLQIFHLHPFEETNRSAISVNDSLLPNFKTIVSEKDIEGALLIGLDAAKADETLSLLFQLNEPSADSYLKAAELEWTYLVGNEWNKLEDGAHILSDTTKGLIQSGIIRMVLPSDFSSANTTILPPQYLWLRVATDARSAAVCRVIGVHTQSVKAVFQNNGNDLLRLDTPLAAGSLKKMVNPLAEIKAVSQIYDSCGGHAPETDAAFYVRTSERLRHKGRAVTLSDYEALVLAAFPDIYKVKCVGHTLAERKSVDANDKHFATGHVTVVVVPNLTHQPLAERFEPKVSRGRLADIEDFLKKRTAPFVRLQVMNPIFEHVSTESKIQFKTGKSPAFYTNQLAADLKKYFAPWAFDPTAKIEFGGKVFASAILGFIEQREYVDFVEEFMIYKKNSPPSVPNQSDSLKEISTQSSRGIFVSGNHVINQKQFSA